MEFKAFRVQNYRSIKDSGMCNLSGDGVTILAGMNESGKTSILEALEDFNVDTDIRKEAYPISNSELEPVIIIKFRLSTDELKEIKKKTDISTLKPNDLDITIGKQADGTYSIVECNLQKIGLLNKNRPEIDDETKKVIRIFNQEIYNKIPNFILFSSFDDVFPSEVALNGRSYYENEKDFIDDFSIISDLNQETILSGSSTDKIKHKNKLNVQINKDYEQYWTQDLNKLHIDWDSNILQFFIEEGGEYFTPKMRSKGKQWHLAFYVKISARSKENKSNVLLIDEPGLYLHPKAQKDILNKLEDSATNAPVILSTHSPYLIDTQQLHRVKLVTREDNGTIITNDFNKAADKESLTPIITSIGLDLSMGLDIAKKNNILVEGISDYYYISAFKDILDIEFKEEAHIIPGAGVEKYQLLVPLFIGWGLDFCVIMDNDTAGKNTSKKLDNLFGEDLIKKIFVSDSENHGIEDLFDRDDFLKYIVETNDKTYKAKLINSEVLKRGEYSKALLAKKFYENRSTIKSSISDQTKSNFNDLFNKINESLFDSN